MLKNYFKVIVLLVMITLCSCEITPEASKVKTSPSAVPKIKAEVSATAGNPYIGGSAMFVEYGYSYLIKPDDIIISYVNWLKERKFQHQFMNVSAVDDNGNLPASKYQGLPKWIQVSRSTDPNQKIHAYISGSLSNVNDPNDWANIAEVVRTLIQEVGVDGVNLDFEPFRKDNVANYVGLFSKIRDVVGPDAFLSLDYTTDPSLQWAPADFKQISSYFNWIMPMSYDTECSNRNGGINCYQDRIRNVWTYQYQNLAAGVQLYPILPCYKKNRWHSPDIENLCTSTDVLFSLVNSGTIAIENVGVWWHYDWDGQKGDTQWNNCWLNR